MGVRCNITGGSSAKDRSLPSCPDRSIRKFHQRIQTKHPAIAAGFQPMHGLRIKRLQAGTARSIHIPDQTILSCNNPRERTVITKGYGAGKPLLFLQRSTVFDRYPDQANFIGCNLLNHPDIPFKINAYRHHPMLPGCLDHLGRLLKVLTYMP